MQIKIQPNCYTSGSSIWLCEQFYKCNEVRIQDKKILSTTHSFKTHLSKIYEVHINYTQGTYKLYKYYRPVGQGEWAGCTRTPQEAKTFA